MYLSKYFKHLAISAALYAVLIFVFIIYLISEKNLSLLAPNNFLRFDAVLYEDIKNNGYHVSWLCAFFPAFPFIWAFLNASIIGISLINSIIFILSSSAISSFYNLDWKKQVFFLTIPSLIFMFVPYTESLFYFSTTLLLIGLKRDKIALILCGLLLASMIRPTTFVFIPAILATYYLTNRNLKQTISASAIPILILTLGLFVTIWVHFYASGKWFVFFEAQKLWENYLHIPHLPFRSWGGDATTRFDGSTLFISLFCGVYILQLFYNKDKSVIPSKDVLFSILYILGTGLIVILYRDGNLYSLNRFVYATPFILVTINYFFEEYEFKWKHLWLMLLISEVFWLMFNSYNHIHNFMLFTTISLYFALILLYKHPNKLISTLSILSLITINSIGIIKLFHRFLNNGWVG
jgi:hypothetical protein